MALLHLAMVHLSTILFMDPAYIAQDATYALLTICYSLLAACRLVLATQSLLRTAYCLLLTAYTAQGAYVKMGGFIMASLVGLVGSVVFLLVRDVRGLITVDLRLYQEDGMPIVLRHPTAKGGYHIFISHCWRFAQDQAGVIKATLTLMLPECSVFLDVDNLKSISLLETYIQVTSSREWVVSSK